MRKWIQLSTCLVATCMAGPKGGLTALIPITGRDIIAAASFRSFEFPLFAIISRRLIIVLSALKRNLQLANLVRLLSKCGSSIPRL